MHFLLPPPVRAHTLRQEREHNFALPPLDGSLTTPQLYDWHYLHNPKHPVFTYGTSTGAAEHLLYSDVVPAIHRAGRYVANIAEVDLTNDPAHFPVVAIVATSDTITFHTTIVGMLRASIPVFPISPRYSPNVIAHLLNQSKATHVLVSVEHSLQRLVYEAIVILRDQSSGNVPKVNSMPTFPELYTKEDSFELLPEQKADYTRPTIIVHSSGSTSLPKSIKWNARRDLQTMMCPRFGNHALCGQVFGCQAVELFHGLGLVFIFWPLSTGLIMACLEPHTPALEPTSGNISNSFQATHPSYGLLSPKTIQEWALEEDKVQMLSKLNCLMYAGAHLDKAVGDYLTEQGVHIYTVYGSTEGGCIGSVFPQPLGKNWEYIEINPHCAAEFLPNGDGTLELVIIAEPTQELAIKDTKVGGRDAYATRDVFVRHPNKPHLYRILGRQDDQILLSTGETINPTSLENIVCQHPAVSAAVFFGRNRPRLGVIVELKKGFVFDPSDRRQLVEFKKTLRPRICKVNLSLEQLPQLSEDMIIVASSSKPFTFTVKGFPRRATILQDYTGEINALYDSRLQIFSRI